MYVCDDISMLVYCVCSHMTGTIWRTSSPFPIDTGLPPNGETECAMNIIIGFNAHFLIRYLVLFVCIDVCICMDRCVSACVGVGEGRCVLVCVCGGGEERSLFIINYTFDDDKFIISLN